MGCETCGDKKPACDKGFTKATLEIKNPSQLVEFRKIVVPASLGDDTAVPPVVGKYCNAILYYEANNQVYIYSSDGIPTKLTTDVGNLQEQITAEVQARSEADTEIWEEIEAIEASSDVVDVVGTYAELQQYDTSKLHNNDLIKVLQDETHGDAITYYRWNDTTNTFSYVGAEGPYYTASETDTLLAAKQDAATAVATVEVDQDESMTVYLKDSNGIVLSSDIIPDFVGASPNSVGYSGLVPQPDGTDIGRFLKGDGTWADAGAIYSAGNGINIDANDEISVDTSVIQEKLTAGANIQINNGTISATDTTYSNFTGATASTAGARGLVPAPVAGDQDKFLKGDGTWETVNSGVSYSAGYGIDASALANYDTIAVDTSTIASKTDIPTKTSDLINDGSGQGSFYPEWPAVELALADKQNNLTAGSGISIDNTNPNSPVISTVSNNINSTDWNALWQ